MTLEEALVLVWRQALEENANLVELEGRRFPVRRTQRRRLNSRARLSAGSSKTRKPNRGGRSWRAPVRR